MMNRTEALRVWMDRHGGSTELAAAAAGVSVETMRRWRRAGAMPEAVATLVDQILNGPMVTMERHTMRARTDWLDVIGATLRRLISRREAVEKAEAAERAAVWRRNLHFRPQFAVQTRSQRFCETRTGSAQAKR